MAIDYKITEPIAELGDRAGGWKLELNKVSWNGAAAKFDIRAWSEDHAKMSKGITLSAEEANALYVALRETL